MPVDAPPTRWAFPPVDHADEDGLVGVGADLEPGTILAAYRRALFPMPFGPHGPVGWWSPDPRAVVPLDGLRVSRSLRRSLRRFEIRTCDSTAEPSGCADDSAFESLYTSPPDAFPGRAPRPVAPDLQMRTFDLPNVQATHVQLVVLTNQCTGGPDFQGDQDTDPLNNSDCVTGSSEDEKLRAAALQVFSSGGSVTQAGDPPADS